MKRIFDIVFSGIALILSLPICLPIMVILRFTGEKELFYRQTRVGYKGREFKLLKFATMLKNSPNIGTGVLTLKNDPRILPFGNFLRKTKLNELPQLWNVLFGDMSIIGPRPQVRLHFDLYPEDIKAELKEIKPGLSGLGSIVFRNEEELMARKDSEAAKRYYKDIITPYKAKLELWYKDNQCMVVDIKLILLTIWVIIRPDSKIHYHIFRDLPEDLIYEN